MSLRIWAIWQKAIRKMGEFLGVSLVEDQIETLEVIALSKIS